MNAVQSIKPSIVNPIQTSAMFPHGTNLLLAMKMSEHSHFTLATTIDPSIPHAIYNLLAEMNKSEILYITAIRNLIKKNDFQL